MVTPSARWREKCDTLAGLLLDQSKAGKKCNIRNAKLFVAMFSAELRRSNSFMTQIKLTQVESLIAPSEAALPCSATTRRSVLLSALATGACLAGAAPAAAEGDAPGSSDRPKKADVFVYAEGDRAGTVIKPGDLEVGGQPVRAWPKDSKGEVIRKGSRLNEVVLLKLDPGELDDDTRARAADGIVAYSVVCTHAGCPITAWVKQEKGDKNVLKCFCHNSEFDPRKSGQVVFGPAPRRLAALPLAISDGALTVAAGFVGKVGTGA
jgi:Rieske Fe-S protein